MARSPDRVLQLGLNGLGSVVNSSANSRKIVMAEKSPFAIAVLIRRTAVEYLLQGLFGEKSLTKVVGLFPDKGKADAAAASVRKAPGMVAGQARVLGPQDANLSRREFFGRTMEPEQRGIFKTLLISHGITGLAGAIAGLLLFAWLYRSGQPMVASSPLLAFIAIVGFAITFGLLLGGLIALRPDHVWLIAAVRSALKESRWAVIVHPLDASQTDAAKGILRDSGAEILKSL